MVSPSLYQPSSIPQTAHGVLRIILFQLPFPKHLPETFWIDLPPGGGWRRLSFVQFATRMGLYTEGDLATGVFDGLHDSEDEIDKVTFWAEVAEGVYDPRRAKTTRLRDPLHWFVHQILLGTILQRGTSLGNVPTRDLFYLCCLIRGIHCNIVHCLGFFLTTSLGKQASSHICGGAYIIQLADSFGLLTEENIASFTHGADPSSNLDLWHRFPGLHVSQEELRAEQERFNQRIDNFQAEQTIQFELLQQIQDDQRQSFEWIFAYHQ
ncbi:hypothetical protein R6Q59_028651 [Mikania micrantha]